MAPGITKRHIDHPNSRRSSCPNNNAIFVYVHASAAATAPYFFLSYPHKSRCDTRDDGEADYWVGEFFRDLCRSVEQQAGPLKGASPGFMDRERRSGDEWPIGVVRR
jgi:hypothetical protein